MGFEFVFERLQLASCLTALWALAFAALPANAQVNERTRKVLEDRTKVTDEGFWIYNDLPAAMKQAQQTGKPLLVILRCLPCEECVKLDDEVVDRDPVIRPLLEQFVCVRVVSTNGLDLSLFQFDTDQSFAAFMLRDEKTIYGRFGTRSHRTEWLGDVSLPGFAEALRGALELHRGWPQEQESLKAKLGPTAKVPRPELFPSLKEKYAYTSSLDYSGDVVRSCIHCHQIGDAIRDEYRGRGEPIPEAVLYPFPHPKSVGLVMDPKTRGTVLAIEAGSFADQAGLVASDTIVRMNGQPILSAADIQWVLHNTNPVGDTLELVIERANQMLKINLQVTEGWRRNDDISWRVSTWGLRRMATGGLRLEPLSDEARETLAFDPGPTAMRVQNVGQYGPHATAKRAGFMVGDIITRIDGGTDIHNETELLRYGVTKKKAGESIAVTLYREGREQVLKLPMQK